MSKTEKNLKDAFAGESQANRKYLAFAQKAQTEGYPQVAKLFRAAAEAETVHAHTHLRTLKGVKSTLENLKESHGGETYEFQSMYPPMIAEAKAEGNEAAVRTFTYANEVEKVHAALYQKAIDNLGKAAGGRGLLRLLGVRLHLREGSPGGVPGLQGQEEGLHEGHLNFSASGGKIIRGERG